MNVVEIPLPLLCSELSSVSFLSCISQEELEALAQFSQLCSFDEGEVLIAEGTINVNFYILMSGSLEVVKQGKWNKRVHIATLRNHASVGESALLEDELSTATVSAAEDSIVLILSRGQFKKYINAYPKAGLVMMTYIVFSLLQKLRSANEELADERSMEFAQEYLSAMVDMFQPDENSEQATDRPDEKSN
ncbi:cyclic nucleotide-binding domain-containing protein [Treponema sp.]|uniref:cyclic nucleotide-binding domain-containing protein n=1 Tax=Treponema sp. TaxID=166 RepID=UPI003FA26641